MAYTKEYEDILRASNGSVQRYTGPQMVPGAAKTTTPATGAGTVGADGKTAFQTLTDSYAVPNTVPSPVAPKTAVTPVATNPNQFIDPNSGQVTGTPAVDQTQGAAQTAANPDAVTNTTVDASLIGDQIEGALGGFQSAQGTLDKASTVQGQMEGLQEGFKDGKTPAWAAGALRSADEAMIGRGLGSSSMAGAARTQAAIEAALPIAQQDAQANLQMQLTNLNNEQQMLLQKNEARTQALFTDVATQNATKQFNAANENQVKQFNSNLKSQVEQFNKSQLNSMSEFNAGQSNAMSMFKAEMQAQREQFNAQNRLIIDQSNAQWRREVTTMDNANYNEANRLNAQIKSNMTLAEYNNLAQTRRDQINYAFTASENAQNRAVELVLAQMNVDEADKMRKQDSKDGMWQAAGSLVAAWFK